MMSGGQAQRIALARALVRKPRLLVLDEVTSGLDAATEAAIFDTLLGMRGTVTILFISHRSAVVDAADLVIRIDAGSIEVETPARASAR
jgi:ABC-type bacteriocin/lantibiotic exporter with double-glycine peptidase domain